MREEEGEGGEGGEGEEEEEEEEEEEARIMCWRPSPLPPRIASFDVEGQWIAR